MHKLSLKMLKQVYFAYEFLDGVKFVFNKLNFKMKCFWSCEKMRVERMFRFQSSIFCSCNNNKNDGSILNKTTSLHEDDK